MNLQMPIHGKDRLGLGKDQSGENTPAAMILSTLRHRWRLIAAITALGTLAVLFVLFLLPQQYTSVATLELNFNRDEVVNATVSSRQVASMDPGALVNGAAQSIASRANASRVVRRLHLDDNPALRQRSLLSTLAAGVRKAFGVSRPQTSPQELAADEILRNVVVSFKQHLYLIGISYTADDPHLAAKLANALAIEHLRSERLKELADKHSAAMRELVSVSETLGELHPRRQLVKARADRLQEQMDAVEQAEGDANKFLLAGQFLTPAEPVFQPAGQKRVAIIALGLATSFAFAFLLAFLLERKSGPIEFERS